MVSVKRERRLERQRTVAPTVAPKTCVWGACLRPLQAWAIEDNLVATKEQEHVLRLKLPFAILVAGSMLKASG